MFMKVVLLNNSDELQLVGFCGLFCGECGTYRGKPFIILARDLKELIEAHGHPNWVSRFGGVNFDYSEFLKGLTYYTRLKSGCFNTEPCRGGCGVPGCTIDTCVKEKGVEVCFDCKAFPCQQLSWVIEQHPDLLEEYKEYQRLGRDTWLKRHLQRMKKGYCFNTKKYYTKAK